MTGGFVRLGWPRRLKRVLMPMYAELPASSCCWPRASVIGWSRAHSRQESPKQQIERSFLAQMPTLWAALSDPERAAWRTFASDPAQQLTNSLGESYFASGYNWFCKCNIRLFRVGRSDVTAIPTQARPAAPTIANFEVTVAGSNPDLASGGVASSSPFDPLNPPALAFDDNPATRWYTPAGTTTGWLQYVLPSTAIIRSYSLYINLFPTTAPADWTFERLDPGPAWTPIDTQTGIVFVAGITQTFHFPNSTSSDTYRINITANGGHATRLAIYEMEYFDDDAGASAITYPLNEFTATPDYDLILKISQGQSAARFVMYPGYRETLAIQGPNPTTALIQSELESILGTISFERSWFARLYRQTQEGIRSAPGTASTPTTPQ